MKRILTMVAALDTLGALFATPSSTAAADIRGNTTAAEDKIAMCIGCHAIPDYKTSFPEMCRVPYLGGQNAKYVESALHTYRKGNHKHSTMRAIAGSLTDQNIASLTTYYAVQAPVTQSNPQRRRGTV